MGAGRVLVSSLYRERFTRRGYGYLEPIFLAKCFRERSGLFGFPMDQENPAQGSCKRFHPLQQLVPVGVRAELIEAGDFGPDGHRFAEDPYLAALLDQLSPEGVTRLKAGNQDGVPRIFDVVAQMVQDATLLAHSGGRDHYERPMQVVQLFGILGIPDVLQAAETEWIFAAEQVLAGFFVKALRVVAVHLGDIHGQGAVDKYGDIGDALLVRQLMEQ